jgi:hypothetical protein
MDVNNCQACQQAREAKRTAIVAVPLTKPNPRWLKRFQAKALDMLLQREYIEYHGPDGDDLGIGEEWFKGSGFRTDEEIIAQACQAADWMRFKRPKLVMGEPTPVVNAFAGMIAQSSRYEDVKAAVKVERTIPDRDGETRIAYLRAQMPDECETHAEYRRLLAENQRLKQTQGVLDARDYVKLSTQVAKATGQELTGRVRIVSFDGQSRPPLQGEVFKPALKPYRAPQSEAPMQDWRRAAEESRLLAEMRRDEQHEQQAKFESAVLKAKSSQDVGDVDAVYAKLGTHRALCTCQKCAHERSIRAKGTQSQWSV